MTRLFIAFLFFSIAPYTSKAQSCKENFLGSKTLYQSQQQKYTAVPKDYQPVFINHVGRHGSRHLTKDVNTSFIYQLLLQADSANGLTDLGKSLKEKVLKLEKIEKNNFKSISERGKEEQVGLADRMYANYSNVFNEVKPIINIAYTKEIRTLQTSDAFMAELKTKINEPAITKQINDTTLRFYDLSPAYTDFKDNGYWMEYLQQLKDSLNYKALANQIMQPFFTQSFFTTLNKKSKDKFTTDLYGFITIFYSIQKEVVDAGYTIADVNMQPFLSCEQLAVLGNIDNAEDYLEKGPATNTDGIQIKIAVPLLADFINTTDAFIKTKTVNAQLRFSHAETISPYATLLGFTTAIAATKNTTNIINLWRADETIPLSSNIQWIIYQKKGEEKYLVKFLLNEKEMAVQGLTTTTFPYYNWNDVRAFYINKLKSFNADLNTDYIKYLNDLR